MQAALSLLALEHEASHLLFKSIYFGEPQREREEVFEILSTVCCLRFPLFGCCPVCVTSWRGSVSPQGNWD